MNIYHQNRNEQSLEFNKDLFKYYRELELKSFRNASLFSYNFKTNERHALKVEYNASFYKMVLCFDGYSETFLQKKKLYAFQKGVSLFYETKADTYTSVLNADTNFNVVHLHLPVSIVENLKEEIPQLFSEKIIQRPIAPKAFELSNVLDLSREHAWKKLWVEKMVLDQVFYFAEDFVSGTTFISRAQKLFSEAKHILENTAEYITIAELAKLLGTNTFLVKKIFRAQGTSVFEYQLHNKLDKAYRYLQAGEYTVSEVAIKCGYESIGSFSNAFKHRFGQRPSQVIPR